MYDSNGQRYQFISSETLMKTFNNEEVSSQKTILQNTGNLLTRKLSYCKDNHVMHPIYGCPEKFRKSL